MEVRPSDLRDALAHLEDMNAKYKQLASDLPDAWEDTYKAYIEGAHQQAVLVLFKLSGACADAV